MKIYKTNHGIVIDHEGKFYSITQDWDEFINRDNLYDHALSQLGQEEPSAKEHLHRDLVCPMGSQEVWASGVTYFKSREARMDESKDAGGGDFYNRVYHANRPELFMKALPHRTAGPGDAVRIRKDSKWNVPEPELTLLLSSSGKIIGYTVGNDMSSRDIEGENPLYLPQAKCYDFSAAIGPCIYVSPQPLDSETLIDLKILRQGATVFSGSIPISQIKRSFAELTTHLFMEMSFPNGCLLMTGTGIVPPNEFTLAREDEIQITIDHIGTLINFVA